MKELTVGSGQLAKLSPIRELEFSSATLICSTCGETLGWSGTTWEAAERIAERNMGKHQCGMRQLTEHEVKQAMIQHRSQHPGLTFEEACKVYNELLKNQTDI